ncbi:indole-3-glycerol phosphate synthase TrpC [Candidatus Sumerlaeota bacterium]|nr:indole-3-glycerol phosphate synthase TrpC [Candidatus Sumerlaeota bacterium]
MILDEIVRYKKLFVAQSRENKPLEEVKEDARKSAPPFDFHGALSRAFPKVHVIAEVKKASPSRGVIRKDFDPVRIAMRYEECGASAVSVLTDEKYFQGSLEILRAIRNAIKIPILRKDFIIDEYQIYEARAAGADAALLIAAILKDDLMTQYYSLARSLNMSVLLEVHSEEELKRALKVNPRIIGINNRNLKDFTVDIHQTIRLCKMIPKGIIIVSESGIRDARDLALLESHGVRAVLVGESLMRSEDAGGALKSLLSC